MRSSNQITHRSERQLSFLDSSAQLVSIAIFEFQSIYDKKGTGFTFLGAGNDFNCSLASRV